MIDDSSKVIRRLIPKDVFGGTILMNICFGSAGGDGGKLSVRWKITQPEGDEKVVVPLPPSCLASN